MSFIFIYLTLLHITSSQTLTPTTPTQSPLTPSPTRFIVSPTLTNSSGQYWIATNNYQFENAYIYCESTSTCHIYCNAPYSCLYSTIICESKSSNCIIQCNENESCHYANITSSSSLKTNLLCSTNNSCLSSTVTISSSIITVKCMHQQSCSSSYFQLISNNNYIENITIQCSNNAISTSSYYSACSNATFNIHSVNSINIKCSYYDCYATTFNASNVLYDMNIECFSNFACTKAIIDAKFTNKLSLKCDTESSCKSAMIYCPYKINSCNIHCKNNYNSTCELLDIYAVNNDSLDLICDTNNNGIKTCYQLEIFCGIQNQLSSYMVLNDDTGNYQCSEVNCCPLVTQQLKTITCAKGYDCNINCDNNPTSCSNKIINGTIAESLHILCVSCSNTIIYCPDIQYSNTNLKTNCIIECMEEYACQYTMIYAGIKNEIIANVNTLYTLNVTCSNDYNSCFQSYIEVYNINMFNLITTQSTENNSISFINPLENMFIYTENTTHVNIECNTLHSCYALYIFTENSKNVVINCQHYNSCDNTHINISTAFHVNINALDQYALINSIISVTESENVNIYCISDTEYACNASTIFIPSSLQTSNTYHNILFCENYGCGHLNIYSIAGMNDLNITIHSNCTCQSIEDCIAPWNLYCSNIGNEYTNVSIFNGTICNGLCCDNIIDETELSFDCMATTIKPLVTARQSYTLFLCIGGLFILCCTTIIVCRKQTTILGLKKFTRREKNVSVMSQYTRMSDWEEQYKSQTTNDRIFNRPKEAQTISELKETDENEPNEKPPALTELLGGYKSLKMYDLDPNRRQFSTASNSECTE